MSQPVESVFAQNPTTTTETLAEAVHEARSSGYATALGLVSLRALQAIENQAHGIPALLRRNVTAWHNTKRATCVPIRRISWKQPYFLAAPAEIWLPTAMTFSKKLTPIVQRIGLREGLRPLAEFQPNRIGINYMHGSETDPARIDDHTDPTKESGLVIAVNLGETIDDQEKGAINLILSKDTCDVLEIPQPVHNVQADTLRLGFTIAQLRV